MAGLWEEILRDPKIMEEKCLEKEEAGKGKKQGVKCKLGGDRQEQSLCGVREKAHMVTER